MIVRSKSALQKVLTVLLPVVSTLTLLSTCADNPQNEKSRAWDCTIPAGTEPDYATVLGCDADFRALASEPMDASIPGAIAGKTVVDTKDPDGKSPLYFQNSKKYAIHHEFTSAHLSGNGKLIVPSLAQFNTTEYYSQNRRFLLGSITYYQGPKIWTYELSPYDNASAAMITTAFEKIKANAFFGDSLYFHPTSQAIEKIAKSFPASIKVISNDDLFAGINYQPLNIATSLGRLVFIKSVQLDSQYIGFRDIVVLDAVPNDISVTSGIITEAFQTPLAHINVLSQSRGTPNMGLRGAFSDAKLRALDGKWVKYTVGTSEYSVTEITKEEADIWWEAHRPPTVGIAKINLDIKKLTNIEDVLDLDKYGSVCVAIDSAIPAFGGKASHYGAFPHMDTSKVPYRKSFSIPVYFYWQFMKDNGFLSRVTDLLTNKKFQDDPAYRDSCLADLRNDMLSTPLDFEFESALLTKLSTEYPGARMRFRSSTNAEDLDGFTGAGLYTSESGDPADKNDPVQVAIRRVWSSVWFFRAFEERSYRNIDHLSVGMAMLVHKTYLNEAASGIASTANPFDKSGLEPAFYINVQANDGSVALPGVNETTDQMLYYFDMPGQPVMYMGHSSLIPENTTVLSAKAIYKVGVALSEIHQFFTKCYGMDPTKFYGMETDFKFERPSDNPNGEWVLTIKQARPYTGMASNGDD